MMTDAAILKLAGAGIQQKAAQLADKKAAAAKKAAQKAQRISAGKANEQAAAKAVVKVATQAPIDQAVAREAKDIMNEAAWLGADDSVKVNKELKKLGFK